MLIWSIHECHSLSEQVITPVYTMKNLLASTLLLLAAGCQVWSTPLQEDYGYVEVRKGVHLFYVAYHVDKPCVDYADYPLVVWLQGGPGDSGVGVGNFAEIGPYSLLDKMQKRKFAWTKKANVLFVDSPVGVGYSYAENKSLLCNTNSQIGTDLFNLMVSFYKKHPAYARMPLHIVGAESHGGNTAAEFARIFHKAGKNADVQKSMGTLRSVTLMNPWNSPIDYVESWGPLLYNMGYVNAKGLASIQSETAKTRQAVDDGRWKNAPAGYMKTIIAIVGAISPSNGFVLFNLLEKNPYVRTALEKRRPQPTRSRMHSLYSLPPIMNGTAQKARWGVVVSSTQWATGLTSRPVFNAIWDDFMRPNVDTVAYLLDHTDIAVNVVTGNLGIICSSRGTYKWLEGMKWSGAKALSSSAHKPFHVKSYKSPAGYADFAHNLTVYTVLRAGHFVPMDAPEETMKLLTRIIRKK